MWQVTILKHKITTPHKFIKYSFKLQKLQDQLTSSSIEFANVLMQFLFCSRNSHIGVC